MQVYSHNVIQDKRGSAVAKMRSVKSAQVLLVLTSVVVLSSQDDVPDVDGETKEDEEGGGSDNGEAAAALLRALARADPTVMSLLKEDKDAPAAATVAPSRCAIM